MLPRTLYYQVIRAARHLFIGLAIISSAVALAMIKSTSSQMSKRYSVQLASTIVCDIQCSKFRIRNLIFFLNQIFSLLSDVVLQLMFDPHIFSPVACGIRYAYSGQPLGQQKPLHHTFTLFLQSAKKVPSSVSSESSQTT